MATIHVEASALSRLNDYVGNAVAASPVAEIMAANNFAAEHTGGGCLAWQRPVNDTGWYITICDEGNGLGDTADEPFMVGLYHQHGEFIDCENTLPLADAMAWGEAKAETIIKADEIARKWLQRIGGGFHLDTSGCNYSPALDAATIAEYEADRTAIFALDIDPYMIAVAAMEQAGMIRGNTPPAPQARPAAVEIAAPMDHYRKARALAATVVSVWLCWGDEFESARDDALRLAFEACRGVNLAEAGEVGKHLAYFAAAYLDGTNPADLTYCQMTDAIAAALSI